MIKNLLPLTLIAVLAGCSSLQGIGDQINSLGASVQKYVDSAKTTEVVYKSPEITKNALLVLGSTWTMYKTHLEAVKDKSSGARSYQAVVAVTYNLQGQFKEVRNYRWADVEVSTVAAAALQVVAIQDAQDVSVLGDALSQCGGVCRVETVTVSLDEKTLQGATRDLLVQVHAGRDPGNFPLHAVIARYPPAYVADFLRQAAAQP